MASATVAVELESISKSFYGVRANDAVDFDLRWGEVHTLLGENGAGKSTLCSILAGLYRPDSGTFVYDGEPQSFKSPKDALAAGIGMVYQHFRLVANLTVAENLALGHPGRFAARHPSRARTRGSRDWRTVRLARRPFGADLAAVRRRAAAGGDPQAAVPQRARPHPGRADGRPDPPGGRTTLRHYAADGGGEPLRHLRFAQTPRGQGGVGQGHGAPRRETGRSCEHDGCRAQRPRQDDGGSGPRASSAARTTPLPANRCCRYEISTSTATAASKLWPGSPSTYAQAKWSVSQACPATASVSLPTGSSGCESPRRAPSWSTEPTSPHPPSWITSGRASATCHRAGSAWASPQD